ncbi:MAG: hypothetical protein V1651_03405 [Patescibacteria group bacterium]
MNKNFVKINIINDKSFLNVCDLLHDGHCDLSTIEYNKNAGTLKVIFEREFFEDPKLITFEPRLLFFRKAIFPIVESELSLAGIKTYKIEDKSGIQIYSFNECQIKNKIYELVFNEGVSIILTFDDFPKGNLIDNKFLNKKGNILV